MTPLSGQDKPPDYIAKAMAAQRWTGLYMGWWWHDGKAIKRAGLVSR